MMDSSCFVGLRATRWLAFRISEISHKSCWSVIKIEIRLDTVVFLGNAVSYGLHGLASYRSSGIDARPYWLQERRM